MASNPSSRKSSYFNALDQPHSARYKEKLSLIDGLDPYAVSKDDITYSVDSFPRITYPDIVNYLVFSPSPFTMDDMGAYKSLEAYNQFVCSWVRDVGVIPVKDNVHDVIARVMHPQRLRDAPLRPWVIAHMNGTVQAAHCDCMAGLGEACTHVAALLFAVEANVRACETKTVTQEKAYWMLPSSLKKVKYSPLAQIDFTSAKSKAIQLTQSMEHAVEASSSSDVIKKHPSTVTPPSQHETDVFFQQLHATGAKSAIFAVTSPYNEEFIPLPMQSEFPVPLASLYNDSYTDLSYKDLIDKCQDVNISLTAPQAAIVEMHTRSQATSKLWFRYRITASRMKAACHTQPLSPSRSLISTIANPSAVRFSTDWGCKHERMARETYFQLMRENFTLEESGLWINPRYPYLGATPDGIISCQCSGVGVLEIKCPYCHRNDTFLTISDKSVSEEFCLGRTEGGDLQLSRIHAYCYQAQTQIFVCSKEFADFVVWSQKDIHIERVLPDDKFWAEISEKARNLFYQAVLPEMVAKYYSRNADRTKETAGEGNDCTDGRVNIQGKDLVDDVWCVCKGNEYGRMIACDNSDCSIVWFHYQCVGIKRKPTGTWYCPLCCQSN